jgi:deoxyhypusine monooxygenase
MTVDNDASSLSSLAAALLNKRGDVSLAVRFRALFALKALASEGNTEAVDIIAEGHPCLYIC